MSTLYTTQDSQYYTCAYSNGTVGQWYPCEATSLHGAKRCATRLHGEGYIGDIIEIGRRVGITSEHEGVIKPLARKCNHRGARWRNCE